MGMVGDALSTISRTPWTALVLTPEGQIVEVVPLLGELTAESFLDFTRKYPQGRPFRLVQQADFVSPGVSAPGIGRLLSARH